MIRHFEEWEWIDFVRGMLPADRRAAIETHLAQACEQCVPMSFLWRTVVARSAQEALYQPPADAVRSVKAAFSLVKLPVRDSWKMRFAQLMLDSAMTPALAGFRSGPAHQRQLAYRVDDLSIEVSVGAGQDGNLAITGQLVSNADDGVFGESRVLLVHDSAVMQEATASEFGEFVVDALAGLTYWLVFEVPGRDPVALPLP